MTPSAQSEWNPKWLAFLSKKGLSTSEADQLDRHARIGLNAEFICWNMRNMTPERKKRFFS